MREFFQAVADTGGPNGDALGSAAAGERTRLSEAQRALWFLDQLTPEGSTQIISRGYWVRGGAAAIDHDALGRATARLVDHHRGLRARFEADGEHVFQRFDVAHGCFAVEELPAAGEGEIERALRTAEARPAAVADGPPFRLTVFVGASAAALLISVHHIAVDGWSFEVILRDLGHLYREELGVPGAALPARRGIDEVIAAERALLSSARRSELEDYWRGALTGAPDRLSLGTDHRGARASAAHGARHHFTLPANLVGRLRDLGAARGATPFATYLAAWFGFLARVSGQTDLVVGAPAAGALRARFPEVVGCLRNPVALRSQIYMQAGLGRLIDGTWSTVLGALDHLALPFSQVVEVVSPSRGRASTPLYHATFLLHQPRVPALAQVALGLAGVRHSLGGIELESLAAAEHPVVFDLSLELAAIDGGLRAVLEYRIDCFDPPTIARLAGAFGVFLEAAVADPDAPIARLPLVAPGGERQAAAGEPAVAAPGIGLAELFAQQVRATPDRIAVIDGPRRVSFRELDERVGRLAESLRRAGVAPGDRVLVCLERSVESVAALLAALRLDAPWVAIEPDGPPDRIRFILEDSQPRALITAARHRVAAPAGLARIDLDDPASWADDCYRATGRPSPDAVAYVVYTSGSTGRPKGVLATHRGTLNRFAWMWQRFPFVGDVACHKTSLAFVDAVWEIFGPLLAGVPLVILPSGIVSDPELLVAALAAAGVTRLVLVPALLRALLELPGALTERLPALHTWFTSGEALPGELAARFFERLPGRRLINLYGASEAAADSTWFEIAEGSPTIVAIGRPIAGTWVYVLDEQLQPVPMGAEGELMVAGEGLARGYLGSPDLTAARFVPDPFAETPGARMYRTGDRARRLPSGDLEYLGRRDHQVKLRGVRIELGEIEAAAARLPAVAQAVATVREDAEPRLVLFWVPHPGSELTAATLAAALRADLPAAMLPTDLVELGALPLTSSGKLDRLALAAIELPRSPLLSSAPAAPRTATEQAVAAIWVEVLDRGPVGVHDDFFALGGRSLLATRVLSRIRARLGVQLQVATLFAGPTVAALAAEIDRAGAGAARLLPALRRSPATGRDRPSFAQERLWLLHQLDPDGLSYQLAASVRARGALDLVQLSQAVAAVVNRHEALRTAFVVEGGHLVTRISASVDLPVPVVDLTGLPEAAGEAAWRAGADALARTPFELSNAPLLRLTIYRLTPDVHVIVQVVHHLVWDDASTAVFLRDLATAYAGNHAAPLAVQSGDVSRWQRRLTEDGTLAGQLEYWRTMLDGAPTSIPLPTDHPRPAASSRRGLRIPIDLSPTTVAALGSIAQAQGAALPATLMAGLAIVLERLTGQRDFLIGLPTAGRGALELEPLIGFFVNTLPIRVQLDDRDTVATAIRRTGQAMLVAAVHQDLPVDLVVRTLHSGEAGGAFFQVALNVRSPSAAPAPLADVVLEMPNAIELGTSKFDLLLDVDPVPDRPRAWLEVDSELFDPRTAARIARHIEAALVGMAAHPDAPAVRLRLLADGERAVLLAGATVEPVVAGGAATIHQRVAEMARRAPGAIALSCGDRRMSYGELEARSNQLAHRLRQLGAGPEARIAVQVDPSIEMVVALLGILKAGAAYLPIDDRWPDEWVSFVLADGGAVAVVTSTERTAGLAGDPLPRLVLDPAWTALGDQRTDPVAERARPGSLAYVIYTSGSTGRPKGVLIPHDRVLRLFDATRELELGPDDVWTLFHSIAFDFSVWEIWGALMHGGRLVIVPHLVSRSPDDFRRLLTTEAVTVLNQTPLAFRQLVAADAACPGPLALRLVLFGGEALDRTTLRPWFERHGDARPRLLNLYGITETTVHNTICWLTADVDGPDQASVGRPIRDVRMLVLDRHGELAPIGVPGEIYVGGAGLARGYLGRPDLTAERFVPDGFSGVPGARLYRSGDAGRVRADGTMECLGRLDRQIKLRGHRIELEDIERTLRGLPAVADAAVAVEGDDPATQVIVAYLVARDGQRPAAADLRTSAGRWLPAYMVPARIHLVHALPRTRNGKLDRGALRATGAGEPVVVEVPEGAIESRIAAIWCDVLGREAVGRSDSFFELGGHSLLVVEVTSRLREELGLDLPVRLMFQSPTLRELAGAVLHAYLEQLGSTAVAELVEEIAKGTED